MTEGPDLAAAERARLLELVSLFRYRSVIGLSVKHERRRKIAHSLPGRGLAQSCAGRIVGSCPHIWAIVFSRCRGAGDAAGRGVQRVAGTSPLRISALHRGAYGGGRARRLAI